MIHHTEPNDERNHDMIHEASNPTDGVKLATMFVQDACERILGRLQPSEPLDDQAHYLGLQMMKAATWALKGLMILRIGTSGEAGEYLTSLWNRLKAEIGNPGK